MAGCLKDDTDEKKAEEKRLLENYIIENNINTEPKTSGLYYIELEPGEGDNAERGNFVIIDYTSWLIDGEIIATTREEIAAINGMDTVQ